MYKHIFTLCTALVSLTAQAESVVTIHTTGLTDGTTLEARLAGTQEQAIAKATIAGDSAVLTLPVTEPRLVAVGADGKFLFKLMTTDGEQPVVAYSKDKTAVYDSPLHAEYVARIGAERERLNTYYEAFHNAYRNKQNEAYRKAESDFFTDVKATYARVIAAGKDSYWGPLAMLDLYCYIRPDDESKATWATFSPAAQESFYGKALYEQIFPKALTDDVYPAISFLDTKGKEQTVERAMKGKRYFLIDFWASWCRPCRAEIPNLKAQYALYAKKGLGIVSISVDQNEAAWRKALEQEQMPWVMGLDRNEAAKAYNVQAIPAIFLVDGKTGKVLTDDLRGETLAAKLAELFK